MNRVELDAFLERLDDLEKVQEDHVPSPGHVRIQVTRGLAAIAGHRTPVAPLLHVSPEAYAQDEERAAACHDGAIRLLHALGFHQGQPQIESVPHQVTDAYSEAKKQTVTEFKLEGFTAVKGLAVMVVRKRYWEYEMVGKKLLSRESGLLGFDMRATHDDLADKGILPTTIRKFEEYRGSAES